MNNRIRYIMLLAGVLTFFVFACEDDIPPVIEELGFDRVFTPIEITARIRNMTTVELNWTTNTTASAYVVEISQDSLLFENIVATVNVAPDELPFSYRLAGEILYSARIKGVSEGDVQDSKWSAIVFETAAENILYPVEETDIQATSVVLKWPAGEVANNFVIEPGNVQRPITQEEISMGEATITGLTGETDYTVVMMENQNQRGMVSFTTLINLEGVTQVFPEDNLETVVMEAEDGAELVLHPGEYLVHQGEIILNKSISIKGLYPHDKPLIHMQFLIEEGAQDITVSNIRMTGDYIDSETQDEEKNNYAFKFNSTNTSHGNLIIQGCDITEYNRSLISTSSNQFTLESLTIDDCVVSNVYNDGGDFIDFRQSYVAKLTLSNCTFINCASYYTRDFIRMDGSSKGNIYDDGTRTPEIEVINCTMHKVMNSASTMKRFFYVRWSQHTIKSEHNLFSEMGISVYSNQSLTLQPECSFNNYFNANGYHTEEATIKIDNSKNFTTLDPGFMDPENGDLTVSNQTLLDNRVGDPRWLGN